MSDDETKPTTNVRSIASAARPAPRLVTAFECHACRRIYDGTLAKTANAKLVAHLSQHLCADCQGIAANLIVNEVSCKQCCRLVLKNSNAYGEKFFRIADLVLDASLKPRAGGDA